MHRPASLQKKKKPPGNISPGTLVFLLRKAGTMPRPVAAQNKKCRSKACFAPALVRLEGLEPPTYWFVANHSIQLSYNREL